MRLMLLMGAVAIALLLVFVGCSLPGTQQAKEEAASEVDQFVLNKAEIDQLLRDAQRKKLEAAAAGDEEAATALDDQVATLTTALEAVKADLEVARARYRDISIEERKQRAESVQGWLNLGLGIVGLLGGGSAAGSLFAARRGEASAV